LVRCRSWPEAWQLRALGSNIPDLKQEIRTERPLDVQVPILRIRQRQIRRQSQVRKRCRECSGRRGISVKWIGEIRWGRTELCGLKIWRCADRRLQRTSLARVIGLVEDPVAGGHQPLPGSGWIKSQAGASIQGYSDQVVMRVAVPSPTPNPTPSPTPNPVLPGPITPPPAASPTAPPSKHKHTPPPKKHKVVVAPPKKTHKTTTKHKTTIHHPSPIQRKVPTFPGKATKKH